MPEKEQIEKFFVEELKIIQDIIKRMAFNSFADRWDADQWDVRAERSWRSLYVPYPAVAIERPPSHA
jgi:hypothetical protein